MNDNNLSTDAQIALIQQDIQAGFKRINEKLDGLASRSELEAAIKDRDSKIELIENEIKHHLRTHDTDISELKAKINKPLVGTALLATIITAIFTFLLTYFLNSLSK